MEVRVAEGTELRLAASEQCARPAFVSPGAFWRRGLALDLVC